MRIPERQAVDFADGSISFLEWNGPRGASTILFAHANGLNASTYRTILAPLSENFRIVAFDMRGHGLTRLPTNRALAAGWTVYRDDFLRVIARIGGDSVLLAGHSQGASAALMAGSLRPRGVRAIVLAEPVLPPFGLSMLSVIARALGQEDRMLPRVAPARRRRRTFESLEHAVAHFRGRGAFRTWKDEQLVMDYVEGGTVGDGGVVRLACDPEWEAANFAVFPFGIASLAGRIEVPLTILHGARHSTAPKDELRRIRLANPAARILCVEGTTHFLPMERPSVLRAETVATAEHAGML